MLQPLSYCKNELIIKKSRFLSECFPIEKTQDVRLILKEKKLEYKGANHVVHSFIIGKNGEHQGSSDDGEPKGTAGHPSLLVLQHSNVTNILVTITRWFGGTLLGTGGLVRAYTESTKALLKIADINDVNKDAHCTIRCGYTQSNIVKSILEKEGAIITNSGYSEDVVYSFSILNDIKEPLISLLNEKVRGITIDDST